MSLIRGADEVKRTFPCVEIPSSRFETERRSRSWKFGLMSNLSVRGFGQPSLLTEVRKAGGVRRQRSVVLGIPSISSSKLGDIGVGATEKEML